MIFLQLFQVFLLLLQPVNAFAQSRSLANPYGSSISFRLPFQVDGNCGRCIDKWFGTTYISYLAGYIENTDLEVRKFSLGGDKRGYAVKYCQIFNTESFGRLQECTYALFTDKKWFEYITTIKQSDEQDMTHVRQLFNWSIPNSSINLFPIDPKSLTGKFPVLQSDYKKGNSHIRHEESKFQIPDLSSFQVIAGMHI